MVKEVLKILIYSVMFIISVINLNGSESLLNTSISSMCMLIFIILIMMTLININEILSDE